MADRGALAASPAPDGTVTASIVELVGPAAAGKTSLRKALKQRLSGAQAVPRLHWSQFILPAVGLAPTVLAAHRPYHGVLWKEAKRMVYIGTLLRAVERRPAGIRLQILDEGPVYMLARLRVFGGNRLESPAFRRWWAEALEEWSDVLTLIVRLDAADEVLINRLRTRAQPHPVRHHRDDAIVRFLDSYRRAYERVIEGLTTANRAIRVLSYRTDLQPELRILDEVVPLLDRTRVSP